MRGLFFGLMVWFFRVLMEAASQWVMFRVPASTIAYSIGCGLVETQVLGLLYGMVLRGAR